MTHALLDLVFPRFCAGCGAWDETLCSSCAQVFAGPWLSIAHLAPYLQEIHDDGTSTTPFPVWALTAYTDIAKTIIVQWKNVQDSALDAALMGVMARALAGIAGPTMFPAWGSRPVIVVPVASARRRRREGRFVAGVLARAVASSFHVTYRDVLRQLKPPLTWGVRRRSGSIAERSRKLVATQVVSDLTGVDVVLVDDVVTSGATLAGARRAIRSAGGRVIGAVCLAHTEHP